MRNAPACEKELLWQVASGDEAAFSDLFYLWKDKLYFFILRITSSPESAQDVTQEVFLKLWTHREKLRDVENFGAYLYSMTRNYAISGLRRMAMEATILSELGRSAIDSGKHADEVLLQKQVLEKVKEVVDQLPRQQRLVYTLSREQGLRQEEIARQLNITVSTVQNHMTLALKSIRKQLSHHAPGALYLAILANAAVAAECFF